MCMDRLLQEILGVMFAHRACHDQPPPCKDVVSVSSTVKIMEM